MELHTGIVMCLSMFQICFMLKDTQVLDWVQSLTSDALAIPLFNGVNG